MNDPRRKKGRSGVVRLNGGSSSYGTRNSLSLNSQGGTFGSGHPAGGGAGAGLTLAAALLGPSYSPSMFQAPASSSVVGPVADIGPPPVQPSPRFDPPVGTTSPVPPPAPTPPTFHPVTSPVAIALRGQFPRPPAPRVSYF